MGIEGAEMKHETSGQYIGVLWTSAWNWGYLGERGALHCSYCCVSGLGAKGWVFHNG